MTRTDTDDDALDLGAQRQFLATNTREGNTDTEIGCRDCEFFGTMRYVVDNVSNTTAYICPQCGAIGEPDDFHQPRQ